MAWFVIGGTMAAGAIAGKMKNDHARDVENSQRNLAAETQRYSPWTGMKANAVPIADSAGSDIFAGGLSGAIAGQGIQKGMAGMKPSPSAGGAEAPYAGSSRMEGLPTDMAGGSKMSGQEDIQRDMYGNLIGKSPTMNG